MHTGRLAAILMKKLLIFLILIFISKESYSFWVWSPKTQKWKNPQLSPLATPGLQFDKAMKEFDAKRHRSALTEFKKVLTRYPDSYQAPEAQYYLGRCWEEMSKPYQAFLEYAKIIDAYPNSKRIQEAVEREYNIGEYFLNREPKKWLGISFYDLADHPSLEIFNKIVASAPYSRFAPHAQYKLGILLINLGRYDEARDAFQKVIDNYPESDLVGAAKYQLATSSVKASMGVDYDDTYRKEAMDNFEEFLKKHGEVKVSQEARSQPPPHYPVRRTSRSRYPPSCSAGARGTPSGGSAPAGRGRSPRLRLCC